MDAFNSLQLTIGIDPACAALGINRAGIYRQRAPRRHTMPPKPRATSALALSETERQNLIDILDSERFVDVAPATIYATLLDENRYHGSVRTMYRVLACAHQTGERRRQRKHPVYTKPELLASGPNEGWSWDISVPQQAAWEMRVWPLAFGLQEQDANHRKRRGSKAPVVSVAEKVP